MPETMTKVTFCYNAFAFKTPQEEASFPVNSTGWTETWYYPSVLDSTQLSAAVQRYANARRDCLATNCVLKAVRYAQLEPTGPKYLSRWDYAGRSEDNNDFSSAVLFTFYDPSYAQRRHFLVRGVPDFYCETGAYLPGTNFKRKMKNWLQIIANDGWKMHGKDITGATAKIKTISLGAGERYVVETLAAHGFAEGDDVQILRTQRNSDGRIRGGKSKVHQVIDTVKVSLTEWPHSACKGGTIRKVLPDRFIDVVITSYDAEAGVLTHRDPGRPFGLSRGRRPVKRA